MNVSPLRKIKRYSSSVARYSAGTKVFRWALMVYRSQLIFGAAWSELSIVNMPIFEVIILGDILIFE